MYSTIAELLQTAQERSLPLWKIISENECRISEISETEVFERMNQRYEVMLNSAGAALEKNLNTVGGLISGVSQRQYSYSVKKDGISGEFINLVMARALSCSETNAAMGRICAAPTAGACGILPAVLISVGERYELKRQDIIKGLITASGIGAVITQNATVSGAEGGCQAECGSAAAMAAAAAVQLAGGSNEASVHAVSIALMNCMGLVCDPVAGLVQVPCAQRNASQAVNGIISADLALAGMQSIVPADEVIVSMYKVGKLLPEALKETSQGGIAATAAAKKIEKEIFG